MPRKHKYPNNEETPVFDSDNDPFGDKSEAPQDIVEKVDKGEVDTSCTCAIKRNPNCSIHMWNDRQN